MYVYLPPQANICTIYCGIYVQEPMGQKAALDPLELQLPAVVSCHLGAENWSLILCNSMYVCLTNEPSLQSKPPKNKQTNKQINKQGLTM